MRLFIGVPLPSETKTRISDFLKQLHEFKDMKVKWVRPESLHITLKFLGETDENIIPKLNDSISEIDLTPGPFSISFENIGFFPNLRKPRIMWIGITDKNSALSMMAEKIDETTATAGFERENRKFKPHLTIGRFKSGYCSEEFNRFIMNEKSRNFGEIHVDHFNLYKSILKPSGAEYKILKSFNL